MISIDRIDDEGLYDTEGLQRLLKLPPNTLRHARRMGVLRYHKAAKRCWYAGRWVKAWLLGHVDTVKPRELISSRNGA